ncbi:hypothetical protein UP09_29375 [Bradyrhizobium sp. LTSP885]|nr:hypothetical protein UP09_29375 [Bradyrhizobium sp. LTSP885]
MASGDGGLPPLPDDALLAPLFIAESISSSADDNAVASVEEIWPLETSFASSCWSRSSGE